MSFDTGQQSCGSLLLSVPRQHAKTGSLLLCRDHPVAATAAFDTPVDAAPAATPVAATVTHAAVACAAVHAAAPHVAACAATCATADAAVASVAHADVTDVCAFRATPVYEMVPRVTPRIQGGGAGVALPATSTPPERSQCHWFSVFKLIFCLGLQCDGDETVQETVLVHLMGSGAGGTAGRGGAAAHSRVRRHRHGFRRDNHCRGQRHGTRHVVTSAAADAVAPPGTAISVAVTVTRAVVTRHTPL